MTESRERYSYGLHTHFIATTEIPITSKKGGKQLTTTENTDIVPDSTTIMEGATLFLLAPVTPSIVGFLEPSTVVPSTVSEDPCPLPMSPSPPGSWEHASASPHGTPHLDAG